MRVRCARGSWLGMTTSGSSGSTATATAAACARRRLTRAAVVPSSSSSSSQAGFPQQQQQASAVPQPLFASLATLATAATASPTFAAKSSSSSSHQSSYHHSLHIHHHHHHQPYHPYHKPSGSSTNNSSHGSGDETEDDERADFEAEFSFPQQQLQYQQRQQQQQQQPHKPQFHPQHHHRLITPVRQSRVRNSNSSSNNSNSMPRRKETKKIMINVPSSEASSGIEGDPHQVFKCNGSPIISPRSIRNSLAETDYDLDGNPRPQKIANTQIPNGTTSKSSSSTSPNGSSKSSSSAAAVIGPALPPPDVASPTTSTSSNGKKKSSRRQKQQPQEDADTEAVSAGGGSTQNDMDLLALKVEEQSLSGMSGVQLWVHRLLYTHHQTLHVLGLERVDFPNTRLSMKQLECMLSPVISLANMMTPNHFGIHVPTPQVAQTMNDVHYWKLWESDTIDIGIFFMPPNAHIPLHNHPGMSVVTRILYGSVNIRSYDLVSPQELGEDAAEVVSESTEIVGPDPEVKWARVSREGAYAAESTMWLDPRRFNLHQIHAASDNGCALLDIMIPPYNNADRDCHHFKIVEERYNKDKNERIVKMLESITADNHNEPTETAPPPAPSSKSPSSQSS